MFLPRRLLRVPGQQRGHPGALYEEDEQHVLAIPRLSRHLRQRVCHVQHPGVCQKVLLGDRVAQGKNVRAAYRAHRIIRKKGILKKKLTKRSILEVIYRSAA